MPELEDLLSKSYRIFLFDTLEHYEHVIEKLTDYLKIDPHNGTAYNNRGLAFSEIGKGKEALLDFAKAMEFSPNDPMPYINRGDLYERAKPTGRFLEAIEDYSRAIAIDGKDATIHRCRAYACLEVNRLHDAIDSSSEAIRLDPDFAQTYIDRSEVYRRLGDDKRAEQDSDIAR